MSYKVNNALNQVKSEWEAATTTRSTPFPSSVTLNEVVNIAKNIIESSGGVHAGLRNHSSYSSWSYATSDTSNNGLNKLPSKVQNAASSNNLYLLAENETGSDGSLSGLWILGNTVLKFASSDVKANIRKYLNLKIAEQVAENELVALESRGSSRSGSTQNDDKNDITSAAATALGAI